MNQYKNYFTILSMSNKFEKANDELILLDKEIKEHYKSIRELQNKINMKGVKR